MKSISNSFKRLVQVASVSALGIGLFILAPIAHAQTFPTYSTPVFNSYPSGSPAGDERDFVRIAPSGSSNFSNELTTCSDGLVANVWVYIHNNAAEEYNGTNNDGSGVAKDVKVAVNAPFGTTNSNFTVEGSISSLNASTVTDNAFVKCGNDQYKLDFVSGSARLYTQAQNGVVLPDAIVSGGTTVGYDQLNGVWPGCWQFVGTVELQVKLTKVTQPVISGECKALTLDRTVVKPGETVTATVTGAATNTTIQGYIFTVKNQNGTVVDTKEVVTNATTAQYVFKQNTAGNYTISASVKFANGNVTSDACVKAITVSTTPPPTTIPNTGAGSILGLLSVTTIAGAIAHRMWTLRKSN